VMMMMMMKSITTLLKVNNGYIVLQSL
jgi:hypothetical protein